MTSMAHDLQCVALRQLETALCLYFEQKDYYSVITLAGASEEMFSDLLRWQLKDALRQYFEQEDFYSTTTSASDSKEIIDKLLKKFEENKKLRDKILDLLREDEDSEKLQDKLQKGNGKEKNLLVNLGEIANRKLKELEGFSGEEDDHRKNCWKTLKGIIDSSKPSFDSHIDAATAVGCRMFGDEAPTKKGHRRAANWVRNMLKHGLLDDTKVVEFDARDEAKDMLHRAIDNYYTLTYDLTPAMEQFQAMHVKDNVVIIDQ